MKSPCLSPFQSKRVSKMGMALVVSYILRYEVQSLKQLHSNGRKEVNKRSPSFSMKMKNPPAASNAICNNENQSATLMCFYFHLQYLWAAIALHFNVSEQCSLGCILCFSNDLRSICCNKGQMINSVMQMEAWREQGSPQLEVAEGTNAILFIGLLFFIPWPYSSYFACTFFFKGKGAVRWKVMNPVRNHVMSQLRLILKVSSN